MNSSKIRVAVIPAAGLGTRFLPATKAVPKEILPVGGKPLIQYAVEEAAASGIQTVILVLGRGKDVVAEHFSRNLALEAILRERGLNDDAELVRQLSQLAHIKVAWQDKPLGLADAIGRTRSLVGDQPFAVILPDVLMDCAVPCTQQLMDLYEKHPGCVIATREVDASDTGNFGILDLIPLQDTPLDDRALRVISLRERPWPGTVASRDGIFGRYILPPEIFPCIEQTRPGLGGELQLTDSILLCSRRTPIYAWRFDGAHYDAGNPAGFLEATLGFALKDPVTAHLLRAKFAELPAGFPREATTLV